MKHTLGSFLVASLLSLFAVLASGCHQQITSPVQQGNAKNDGTISPTFNFNSKKDFTLHLSTQSSNITSKPDVPVSIYDGDPSNGGNLISTLVTDNAGNIDITIKLPSNQKRLFIRTQALGLPSDIQIPAIGSSWSGDFETAQSVQSAQKTVLNKETGASVTYKTLGTWNSAGVPNYLVPQRDLISNTLLQKITTSLPESIPVLKNHPEYLATGNTTCTEITEKADVWVTFVHEGAGYQNTFGFYTYDKSKPPTSQSDVQSSMTIIFPNTSYYNSGGGLYSGDKVYLGTFDAGTVIGWFVISNGFSNGKVTNGIQTLYSNSNLNIENSISTKQHTVILRDPDTGRFVIGFEDMNRDNASCDNDFNDVLYYVTSNPVKAIPTANTPLLTSPASSPKTFTTYLPAQDSYNSLVFEDLWPYMGDYDFNDLVVDYNYTLTTNSSNQVTSMKAHFVLKAIGAGLHSGFAVELPVASSTIQAVTGSILKNKYISLSANGTESGQQNAVIVVFDDAYSVMSTGGSEFVNTIPNSTKVTPVDIIININFLTPQPLATLTGAPYNPFLIVNKDRKREIHLPNMAPTSKADLTLLGTGDDTSILSGGRYYKSKNNMPWALDVPNTFKYPVEKAAIYDAYINFYSWAKSNGTSNTDWYLYTPANVNDSKVYK